MSTEVMKAEGGSPVVAVSPLRPLMGIACVFLVAVVAFAVGLATGIEGPDVTLYGLAILTVAAGLLPLILDTGRSPERRHVLLSLIGVVYGLAFAVPVFDHYIPALPPLNPPGMSNVNLSEADIAKGQLFGLGGLLLLYAGYALPLGNILRPLLPEPRFEWSQRGALTAAGILIPLGWAVYLAGKLGMLPARLGSGFIGGFMDLALLAPGLLALTYLRYRSRVSFLLLLVFVPLTSGFNFLTGSKKLILLPWAMAVLGYFVYTRRVRIRWMIAGALALTILYPAAQFYRDEVIHGFNRPLMDVIRSPVSAIQQVLGFIETRSFLDYIDEGMSRAAARVDAVGTPAVIIRDTPSVVPFQNGRTLAYIPVSYIPRIVWPGKPPMNIGLWLNEKYNASRVMVGSNLGPSWMGEYYLNFGTPAVVLGMLCLGAVFRVWHEIVAGRRRTLPLMLTEVVVVQDVVFNVTGALIGIVNGPVVAAIPLAGTHLLLRFFGGVRPAGDDSQDEKVRTA